MDDAAGSFVGVDGHVGTAGLNLELVNSEMQGQHRYNSCSFLQSLHRFIAVCIRIKDLHRNVQGLIDGVKLPPPISQECLGQLSVICGSDHPCCFAFFTGVIDFGVS